MKNTSRSVLKWCATAVPSSMKNSTRWASDYLPTQSNFIFLTDLAMDANMICDLAMQKGVIMRPTDPFGLPDHIRITIAREEENARIVGVLQEIIGT